MTERTIITKTNRSCAFLQHEDHGIRIQALVILGKTSGKGDEAVISAVIECFTDADATVRFNTHSLKLFVKLKLRVFVKISKYSNFMYWGRFY